VDCGLWIADCGLTIDDWRRFWIDECRFEGGAPQIERIAGRHSSAMGTEPKSTINNRQSALVNRQSANRQSANPQSANPQSSIRNHPIINPQPSISQSAVGNLQPAM
jgi:hypothetical protein